jgi:hypothetical protein
MPSTLMSAPGTGSRAVPSASGPGPAIAASAARLLPDDGPKHSGASIRSSPRTCSGRRAAKMAASVPPREWPASSAWRKVPDQRC